MRASIFGAAMLVAMAGPPAMAQDAGGEDHAALPRYPGATIVGYRGPSTDAIVVPTGDIADADGTGHREAVEGQVTHIDYRIVPAVAPLQIDRYYAALLAKQGFGTIFACTGPACGRDMSSLILNSGKVAPTGLADGVFNDRNRVRVARRGSTWIVLHIAEGPDRSMVYEAVVDGAAPAAP